MPPALNHDALQQDALKYDARTHFAFGRNWARYSETITEEDIEIAEENLKRLLGLDDLHGKSFLDIGCGSGIHALAALRMGAKCVHGIDIDEDSVATAKRVLTAHANRTAYTIEQGNIFEVSPEQLGHFDVVYSWGVLHHTGDMWPAIRNAAGFAVPGGVFALAIYRKTGFCGFWRWEKSLYVRSGKLVRGMIVSLYMLLRVLRDAVRLRNPIRRIRGHNRNRGMKWYTNVIDWLGGYPYQSATAEETGAFVEALGFRLEQSWTTKPKSGFLGTGNAEYRFRKA